MRHSSARRSVGDILSDGSGLGRFMADLSVTSASQKPVEAGGMGQRAGEKEEIQLIGE
jgi:hypothetical protein